MAATTVLPITHIVRTPNICGGAPRINGTRITVDWIVGQMLYAGRTVEHMVEDYAHVPLTPAQVHAALAYFYDHRAEIGDLIARSDALLDDVRRTSDDWRSPYSVSSAWSLK